MRRGARPAPASGAAPPGPTWELEHQLAVMNTQFNRRVLIDLFVWNDDQDSSRHIIYVRAARRAGPVLAWLGLSRLSRDRARAEARGVAEPRRGPRACSSPHPCFGGPAADSPRPDQTPQC